ncbi:MAG: hypothetical protein DYG93_10415 [Leptolyngbya sp. PLA2]|nr:hypothetical protein [Leptolyngbya sp. PL-A2]MCQ3940377.1 hypothetical protein [cyanobacterium CYA1]MCZ7633839.1 hypothetical protein [Phycisphaerales bacterium]MDL1904226.1 hypothetical protein [Synechococcales cyanobacterium CNB]GIK19455.1 MAG: hypothetical protein BroJett004_16190 [Planctomycetota bacterium]
MRVIFDEAELLSDAATLEQGLRAGTARAEELGRLIVEVIADGEPVPGELLDNPASHTGSFTELRMTSAEPAVFLRVTLMEAADALEQAGAEQLLAADHIDQGRSPEAYQALGVALGVWDAVRDLVQRVSHLLGFDLTEASVVVKGEEIRVDESVASLSRQLEEVRRCVAADDLSGLADALRYELSEEAGRWRELLTGLAEAIRNAQGEQ